MAIITQDTELKNIAGDLACTAYTEDDNFAITGYALAGNIFNTIGAETKWTIPIRAAAQAIRVVQENAKLNFTSSTNQSDMTSSLAVQRVIGGSPSGGYSTVYSGVSIPKGQTYLSPELVFTLAAGDEINFSTYGLRTTAGKFITGTRQQVAPQLGVTGNSLVFAGDGNFVTNYGTEIAWGPGAVLAKTKAKGIVCVGHSLTTAIGNFGYSGPMLGAELLGVPYTSVGVGGALITAWTSAGNYDILRMMARNCILFTMINAIDNFAVNTDPPIVAATGTAVASATGVGQTVSLRDTLTPILKRLAALGMKTYIITENFPDTNDARHVDVWSGWNEWLVASGPAYYGATLLAGVIDARSYICSAPYTQFPVVLAGGATFSLHANWSQFGDAVYDYFKTGGPGAAALVPDTSDYLEAEAQPFWGATTTPGVTALGSWFEWYFASTEAYRVGYDGTGGLKVVNPTTKTTWAMCPTPLSGTDANKTFKVTAVSKPWVIQTDGQGLHLGLCAVVGDPAVANWQTTNVVNSFNHEGYSLRFHNNAGAFILNSSKINSTDTGLGTTLSNAHTLSATPCVAGDIITVEVTRALSGANQVLTVQVYRNGTALTLKTITDTAPTSKYTGNLYLNLGTAGTTATTHTNGSSTWDAAFLSNIDATTIDFLTSSDMIYVPRGGGHAIDVYVEQSAPIPGPSGGQSVTASVTGTGATVGSAATTNGSGIARFSGDSALRVTDAAAVGATGNVTFVCGGQNVVVPYTVIDPAYPSGGGGGGVGGGMPIGGGVMDGTVDFSPSDTVRVTDQVKASAQQGFYPSVTGTLRYTDADGNGPQTLAVTAGQFYPWPLRYAYETGTTVGMSIKIVKGTSFG